MLAVEWADAMVRGRKSGMEGVGIPLISVLHPRGKQVKFGSFIQVPGVPGGATGGEISFRLLEAVNLVPEK